MLSFIKIDRAALYKEGPDDTTKLIPVNESQCCFENQMQKEVIVTYSTKCLFNIFEDRKTQVIKKFQGLFRDNTMYLSELQYMLVVSYKDYLSDEIKTKYFIINSDTAEEIQKNEGEVCYEQIKGAASTKINDLDEEFFGKLLIQ